MKENAVTEEYKLLLKRIGENLALERKLRGMTQRELSDKSGKNQTVIAKVEKYAPVDISLRNIYEVTRHIPVSLSQVVAKAEKDLELSLMPRSDRQVNKRLKLIMERLEDLSSSEQAWMADMMEGLLSRTSAPSKSPDNPDILNQSI